MHKILFIIITLIILTLCSFLFMKAPLKLQDDEPKDKKIVMDEIKPDSEIVTIYKGDAKARLLQRFAEAGLEYPPKAVTFLAIKSTGIFELWVNEADEKHYVTSYPIKAQSGIAGPKLREGDYQVPEGLYRISWLHPNSSYHRSMKINYPNKFDRIHAKNEGRTEPGTNIFIHGRAVSIGCLAMGDPAIEELYLLVQNVGKESSNIVIAPTDPRKSRLHRLSNLPWTDELYTAIEDEFKMYVK